MSLFPPVIRRVNGESSSGRERKRRFSVEAKIKRKGFGEKLVFDKTGELLDSLPVLRKLDIDKFRNSYKHNLCLDMLTTGFHNSFCELVTLIRQQMEKREAAGPESFLWAKPVLQDEHKKLEMLKHFLTKAEGAKRKGHIQQEYTARYELAKTFTNNPDDQWLAYHFFGTCLEVARRAEVYESKMYAEGLCNVGLCLQKNHHYKEAAKHFEQYHKLAVNNKTLWLTANGTCFYKDSCVRLYHIYTIIGLEMGKGNEDDDSEASLQMLIMALDMAKNSQDKKLEGEASYNLGLAYQKVNQLENAKIHLFNFYESLQGESNSEGIGRACDAIAKIYARQGNKEKSVEFLKRFVELTEKTGLEREYCLACHNLGNVCNSVGNYDEATEYFSKAYNISRALGDLQSANVNRVQYGIAVAHRIMGKFANHIVIADKLCISRLLGWKSVRRDEFAKPIPNTDPNAGIHLLIPLLLSEEKKKSIMEENEEGMEMDEYDLIMREENEAKKSN